MRYGGHQSVSMVSYGVWEQCHTKHHPLGEKKDTTKGYQIFTAFGIAVVEAACIPLLLGA